jgi:hypothetical protein
LSASASSTDLPGDERVLGLQHIPQALDKKIVMRVDMGHAFPADLISEGIRW